MIICSQECFTCIHSSPPPFPSWSILFYLCRSEFENLPLLRSTFFHLGLSLARSEGLLNAVVEANDMGEANIYLNSKADTSFHYTLYNCKNGSTSIKAPGGKFPLDRYREHCINIKTEEKNTSDSPSRVHHGRGGAIFHSFI